MITAHIQPILLMTGLITALAVVMFLGPRPGLKLLFDVERADPGMLFIARHWGLTIALVGMLLVVAAYQPSVRGPAMAVAATEKCAIVGMICFGWPARTTSMRMIAFGDGTMAVLYLLYFAGF